MTINLSKGQRVDLTKSAHDLSRVTVGLGWDVAEPKRGVLGRLLGASGKQEDYDLDAVAFLLGEDGRVPSVGNGQLEGGDVVFFNNQRHPSGHVWLTGDNRTGAGDGDDEQIVVQLDRLDQRYRRVVFAVQIYQGEERNQHFSAVTNAFIRAVDARGREMARYTVSTGAEFAGMCSVTFAELERGGPGWRFHAIGRPHRTDSFVELLKETYI